MLLRFSLLGIFFLSALALADLGLPANPNSWDLFRRDPETGNFTRISPSEAKEAQLYVRYSFEKNNWVWCSGKNPNLFLEGSKLQGWRLGLSTAQPEHRGLNWFRLKIVEKVDPQTGASTKAYNWQKTTDRIRPQVWREDEIGRRYLAESYPDEWVNWGGDLDPIDGKPTCEIIPQKPKVFVGERVTIEIRGAGKINRATFNGQTITLPSTQTVTAGPEGTQAVEAFVEGPGGNNTCRNTFTVEKLPTANPPSCELKADKAEVDIDLPVKFTLLSKGTVDSAFLDGSSIEPNGTRDIKFATYGDKEIRAVVYGENRSASCSATVTVKKPTTTGPLKCDLRITPNVVKVNEDVVFTLTTEGPVERAELDGKAITLPFVGQKVRATQVGSFNPTVTVFGAGGTSATCRRTYEVTEN